ncbi:surface-adhesin E family protein [Brevundimonas lenta]|uniref:Surface-adhesin protein E-like domain-containing protein n=1 Tax=Brevundimonas lenta TaxID=424796 RepID=A0A7W6JFT5_9CAUL|nr:surface-adhesin E family protein [Brevundimonas lenta]MBB4084296.1 hypothetical protein [Brevundimonas lenta]
MRTILLALAALGAAASSVHAEDWNSFSRSTNNVFMADVDAIGSVDGMTTIIVATVPLRGDADDFSHSIETYELDCGARKWRTTGIVEYGPDGAELDRFPEANPGWEPVRSGTVPEHLKAIACDGARAEPPTFTSIKAWVEAGRP